MTFDHIALRSSNIEESLEYYRSIFPGLAVLYKDSTWALVELNGLKIAFVIEDEHPPHIALRVKTREELAQYSNGDTTAISLHRDKSESLYLEDPSGNQIEIIFYPVSES